MLASQSIAKHRGIPMSSTPQTQLEAFVMNEHQSQYKLPSLHQMLQELVAARSVSSYTPSKDESNKAVIDLLCEWCENIGMTTHVQKVAEGKYNLIAQIVPNENQFDPNLKGIMFAGHTDTVGYMEDDWNTDPFDLKIINDEWFGLGVCDMKGFFPIALQAIAETLNEQGKDTLKAPITLIATSDEETTMDGARALSKLNIKSHQVIIGEPSDGQAIYAHKGVLTTKLIIKGVRGHASNPSLGANAIEAAHWVIGKVMDWKKEWQTTHVNPTFKIPHPTFNFGCIHGGDNSNVICDKCELMLDMRLLPNMPQAMLDQEFKQRLQGMEEAVPGTSLEIITQEFCPPYEETQVPAFSKLLTDLTQQPLVSTNFVTEAPFLQEQGHHPFILGPGSIDWAHKPNERLALSKIQPLINQLKACLKSIS